MVSCISPASALRSVHHQPCPSSSSLHAQATVISAAVGRVNHHTSTQSALPPAGLGWWKQTPVSAPQAPTRGRFPGHCLPPVPCVHSLTKSFIYSCNLFKDSFSMPDAVLGTESQHKTDSPVLSLVGGQPSQQETPAHHDR